MLLCPAQPVAQLLFSLLSPCPSPMDVPLLAARPGMNAGKEPACAAAREPARCPTSPARLHL